MAPVPGRRLSESARHHGPCGCIRSDSATPCRVPHEPKGWPLMSAALSSTGDVPAVPAARTRGLVGRIRGAEDVVVSLALGIMVILPLAEAGLRRTFHVSIPASTSIVQHMVLIVGMLGGAIAARENRLLSLSNFSERFSGRLKSSARVLTCGISATVCGFLALAALQFVESEREAGTALISGIPVWYVECVLPIGFAVIALRILWQSGDRWSARFTSLAVAVLVAVVPWLWPASNHHFAPFAMSLLLLASILGVPALVTLGGAALILFWGGGQPIAAIPVAHYALVTNPALPTLPLFTLAGYFLAEGSAPRRLIRVFYALFGQFRGGPAIVTVLVCAFFTSFTGASGVTILALGGLLMPVLMGARYTEKDSLGLLTGAGSLGLLLPPCLPLIVYAIVAKVPIERMFLGALLPAFVMIAATALWGVRRGSKIATVKPTRDLREIRRALWDAKWELFMPIFASVALFSGLATPVEAAALTALYAFVIEVVIHRDLHPFRDIPRVMAECGLLIGGVLLILGASLGFTNYFVEADV